ncbi:hypothetical protein [Paenibacillus sp. Root444D2]|uniref:hypothetical protein n=1 Tax=Paenibacillus sp. Root444D2 TaxID=1736538 RepID=UPI000708CFAF|nr:hypothetical protein [Paenibacillus sp. Root444D2]KQX45413.1 hypothetical protein ASD40_21050 [Paenibacillus sp. Root444D2]
MEQYYSYEKQPYDQGSLHKSRVDVNITMKFIVKVLVLSRSPTLTMKNMLTSTIIHIKAG